MINLFKKKPNLGKCPNCGATQYIHKTKELKDLEPGSYDMNWTCHSCGIEMTSFGYFIIENSK